MLISLRASLRPSSRSLAPPRPVRSSGFHIFIASERSKKKPFHGTLLIFSTPFPLQVSGARKSRLWCLFYYVAFLKFAVGWLEPTILSLTIDIARATSMSLWILGIYDQSQKELEVLPYPTHWPLLVLNLLLYALISIPLTSAHPKRSINVLSIGLKVISRRYPALLGPPPTFKAREWHWR